jgi:hypothetical protein
MRPVRVARRLFVAVALLGVGGTAGCVHIFQSLRPQPLAVGGELPTGGVIKSPLRAHLADGSTVVFRNGAVVAGGRITGRGLAYALLDDALPVPRDTVSLSSVVGVETFETKKLVAQSIAVSLAATAAAAAATAGALVAIFGSCPTIYADTGAGPVLQAEGFSYAIAPLLEHRDLDPLGVRPGPDGIIRLELRNEALETHFINHIELVAVRHAPAMSAMPDQTGRVVLVGGRRALATARDRAGRDVRAPLASADGELFASAPATLDAAHAGDVDDWIDLDADALPAGDSIAVVLRLRNSLLNTVLLYDGILGGVDAADWLASGMLGIGNAIDLSRWYVQTMGMHATVDGVPFEVGADGRRTAHARLGDVGPIAFRDVAMVLPRPSRDARHVRVRLRFVTDDWRIDRAEIAGVVARPVTEPVRLARVVVPVPAAGGPAQADSAALAALHDADDRYLETRPGQRMTLEFVPASSGRTGADTTTYLIAWQGWYREWIRGAWLAAPTRTTPWVPGDSAVATALARWRTKREPMEREFYSSRIPVR